MFAITQKINFGRIPTYTYNSDYERRNNYNGIEPDTKILKTTAMHCPQKADIADIGAGDGRNTIPLAKLGHNIDAFEFSDVGAEVIKEKSDDLPNVKVLQDNVLYQPLAKKYDEIFMSHVTQHFNLKDMQKAFKNISDGLKQGGIFIFDALIDKHNDVLENTILDEGGGTCHFQENSIKELVEKNNFKIIDIEDFKEAKASRGDYYGPEWGFLDTSRLHLTPRPLKLKWFTLKKL